MEVLAVEAQGQEIAGTGVAVVVFPVAVVALIRMAAVA
jgi:hypothetical protein